MTQPPPPGPATPPPSGSTPPPPPPPDPTTPPPGEEQYLPPTESGSRTDPEPTSGSEPAPAQHSEPQPTADPLNPLRSSRTSAAWGGLFVAMVLLVLLVIFIFQNTGDAEVAFLWLEGTAPQAVLLLVATVVGMVIVGLVGTMRILQLRRRVKRDR